nr:ribonuclease H-like domain-containing protein [Tanacetum cinerariifolium]
MAEEDTSQPPQPPIASPEVPQMVSYVKLPNLKKGEYILWTVKMEQYLAHTDYALWEQILARTKERKANSTLLMAIPDEHLARFHGIKDAKTLWAVIKTRLVKVKTKDMIDFKGFLACLKFMEQTMKMEQYLAHTDYALWEVILNDNSAVQITKNEAVNEVKVPPVTTQQILARTRERNAKSTLLMAILDKHLARFHRIKDAKTLW